MIYRKITFARVRMLVLTCVILLGVFGQIGVQRTAQCFSCELATCPLGPPGSCFQRQPFGHCVCYRYDGALALCNDNARK
jgi:hypothetical protein